jgi:hypothetical protein
LLHLGIAKHGLLVRGFNSEESAVHSLYLCIDEETGSVIMFDGALYGKLSSEDQWREMKQKLSLMVGSKIYSLRDAKPAAKAKDDDGQQEKRSLHHRRGTKAAKKARMKEQYEKSKME